MVFGFWLMSWLIVVESQPVFFQQNRDGSPTSDIKGAGINGRSDVSPDM
jgi:hypothetical protein